MKKEFRYFSIFQYEKEQEYLQTMHQNGWRFVKVSGLGIYHFEACEPEDVIYQLDYNQEGIQHKEEYQKMFADCGWEYLQEYAGYSYFRKPASDAVENESIFCDDESRAQMFERVIKGRLLPLLILFSMVLVPQFILSVTTYETPMLTVVYAMILLLYLVLFFKAIIFYQKYKK